ncbi:MAG: hypothetical protein KGJ62_05225 [Armatimonadetes bacterium]|nr:hypothetical protein [Armatimonadota bacterium]MDE2207108.1 hypothetical protein [Armatimonadota bacterium]
MVSRHQEDGECGAGITGSEVGDETEGSQPPRLEGESKRDVCCDDNQLIDVIRNGAGYAGAPAVMGHLARCGECQTSYRNINKLLAVGAENRLREAIAQPANIVKVVRAAVRRRQWKTRLRQLPINLFRMVCTVLATTFLVGLAARPGNAPSNGSGAVAGCRYLAAQAERGGLSLADRIVIAGRCLRIGVGALVGRSSDSPITTVRVTPVAAQSNAPALSGESRDQSAQIRGAMPQNAAPGVRGAAASLIRKPPAIGKASDAPSAPAGLVSTSQ